MRLVAALLLLLSSSIASAQTETFFSPPFCAGAPTWTPTVTGGRLWNDRYATFNLSGGCLASALGPRTLISSAHCIDTAFPTGSAWAATDQSCGDETLVNGYTAQKVEHPTTSDVWTIYRAKIAPGYLECVRDGTHPSGTSGDLVILWTHPSEPPLPGPYIEGIYDTSLDNARCSNILIQGNRTTPMTECDAEVISYVVGDGSETASVGSINALCAVPAQSNTGAGDSGGPWYAFVDHDDDPLTPDQLQIAGTTGGQYNPAGTDCGGADPSWYCGASGHWSEWNRAWIEARWNDPIDPIVDMGFGITLNDFYVDRDMRAPINMAQAQSFPCVLDLSASIEPIELAGCSFHNTSNGQTRSCFTTESEVDGTWRCNVDFPAGAGKGLGGIEPGWTFSHIFARDALGNKARVTLTDLWSNGAGFGLYALNWAGSSAPPYVSAVGNPVVLDYPSVGGEYICVIGGAGVSSAKTVACVNESAQYANGLLCVAEVDASPLSSPSHIFCERKVPLDVPQGSAWDVTVGAAQDLHGFSKTAIGVETFYTLDCTKDPALQQAHDPARDLTATGAWSTTGTHTATYGDSVYGFWARSSSNDGDAIVALSDVTPIDDISKARIAIRFNSATDKIEVWDGGVWAAGFDIPYEAGTWYYFLVDASKITSLAYLYPFTYTVDVAKCGQPRTPLIYDAAGPATRIYDGIKYHAVQADPGVTADIFGIDFRRQECSGTNICDWNTPAWNCGTNIPNGCGLYVAWCGNAEGNLDCGDGPGGLECINYVCQ